MIPGLVKIIEPIAERELNTKAREYFDLYAMLVPYRLRVSLKEPDAQTIARIRTRQEERRKAEEKLKREKVLSYIREGLSLEEVRVSQGKRFGQQSSRNRAEVSNPHTSGTLACRTIQGVLVDFDS